jgi:hypothetical protein
MTKVVTPLCVPGELEAEHITQASALQGKGCGNAPVLRATSLAWAARVSAHTYALRMSWVCWNDSITLDLSPRLR